MHFSPLLRRSLWIQLVLWLLLAFAGSLAIAQEASPSGLTPESVRALVERFLINESKQYSGKVSHVIGNVGNPDLLAQCQRAEVRFNTGARPYGRTNLGVRCLEGARWQIVVPVQIKVSAITIAARLALANGQVLTAADLTEQEADLGELPSGVLTDADLAIGRVTRMAIPAGRVLRSDMLKTQSVITAGQTVKITTRGPGFEVGNEGVALNSAGVSELVKVRLANGQVVSGRTSSDGRVEISF